MFEVVKPKEKLPKPLAPRQVLQIACGTRYHETGDVREQRTGRTGATDRSLNCFIHLKALRNL